MKRLIQISLDTMLTSMLPILMWILLGLTFSKEISNIFTLTYPLQFFYMIFISLFAIGPNITSKKLKDDTVVFSNMLFGTIFVGIVTIILVLNTNKYITLMSMDPEIYHNFCIYSMIWMYISFIMQIITQKLYYEDKNAEANKINMILNLSNFLLVLLLTNTLKDYIAIFITLLIDFLIIIFFLINNFKKTKFSLKIKYNIKYTSFNILRNIGMFFTYGIRYGNSFSYGEKFATAINFESLTTDTQWDILSSVSTASKIDLSKNKFDYKESLKNAYKLLAILIGSTLLMNIMLYWYFKPDIKILSIILSIQIIDMLVDPLKTLRLNYLQVNANSKKHNIFYALSRIIRLSCSFIPSAFCTYIGQVLTMIFLYVYSKIQCKNVKLFNKKTL